MSKIFSEDPKSSLKEWIDDKDNFAKIVQLSGINDQFKDIIEILVHIPIKDAAREIFQIFDYSFQVR